MAYRFLLEVPEKLAAEANIAVAEAGDAQVLVARNSHARPLDEPFMDLTIAAQSLRVVHALQGWFERLGRPRPDVRLVLHGGERLRLEEHEAGSLVAAVRRDQPWVEHTIPKIGDHAEEAFFERQSSPTTEAPMASPTDTSASAMASTATLERTWSTLAPVREAAGSSKVAIREVSHVAIRVADLERAEHFYVDFLGMEIVGRARRAGEGFAALPADYDWRGAIQRGDEPDVSFLRNGPLVLALQRAGRGAIVDRGALDHISVRVDASTFTALKGQVLMRSMEVVGKAETAFAFRDPFGITWELSLQGVPDYL
jgi:catechol 2,3-dioxygenase-like lactoylglutathione lyase family enzyme